LEGLGRAPPKGLERLGRAPQGLERLGRAPKGLERLERALEASRSFRGLGGAR
jgi:hypothetical protein